MGMTTFLKRKKLELQNHLKAYSGIGFQLKNNIFFVSAKWIIVLSQKNAMQEGKLLTHYLKIPVPNVQLLGKKKV